MCFGNNGFGGNGCLWIILLIIVLCCCCGNNGASENSNGCGCNNGCGCCPYTRPRRGAKRDFKSRFFYVCIQMASCSVSTTSTRAS